MFNMECEIKDVNIEDIEFIENARTRISDSDVAELMIDMRQRGQLQPVGVVDTDGKGYIFVFGSRRIAAAKKLGWKTIEAKIYPKDMSQDEILISSTAENIHRKDLSPTEIGRISNKLVTEYDMNPSEVAARLSVTKAVVESSLRLWNELPEKHRHLAAYFKGTTKKEGHLSATVLNRLISLKRDTGMTERQFDAILEVAKSRELTYNQTALILRRLKEGVSLKTSLKEIDDYAFLNIAVHIKRETWNKVRKLYPLKSQRELLQHIVDTFISEQKV